MEEIKRMYERQKAGRVKSMIIFLGHLCFDDWCDKFILWESIYA